VCVCACKYTNVTGVSCVCVRVQVHQCNRRELCVCNITCNREVKDTPTHCYASVHLKQLCFL
jgi:hypothetical protein